MKSPYKKMSKQEYDLYLRSTHWKNVRAEKLRRQPMCQHCHKNPTTQIHHKHYRSLGRERLSHLKALCDYCHRQVHALLPVDGKVNFTVSGRTTTGIYYDDAVANAKYTTPPWE